MPLINCEINSIVTFSAYSVLFAANGITKFAIGNTKIYVPVVTLSTQDNAELLQQLKSTFQRRINRIIYQSKKAIKRQNQFLDYLFDPSFQKVSRIYAFSFQKMWLEQNTQDIFF